MKKIASTIFLFVLCTFILQGQALAASVPSSNSVHAKALLQQEKANASMLLEQGNYASAYEAYARLLREDPYDDTVNLGYARSALQSGKPGQAVMAYERLLTKHPDEPILLKELAYALSVQNDDLRASMELAKNTEASTEESADLAKKWSKQHSRTQVSGKVSAGLIYDSNANSGPASNELSIGSWDINLNDGKSQETLAGYLGAQVDLGYRLDIVSPWWLVGSANVFARYNTSPKLYDMKLSSSEFGSASFGIRYLGTKSMFDIRAKSQIFDYAFEQNVIGVGPEVNFIYAATPKLHLITRGHIENRSYSSNDDYSGWYGSLGQYVRYFTGDAGHNITLGGRYLGGAAKEMFSSYDGYEISLEFVYILPFKDIRLSPYISYGGEYFYGAATVLEEDYRHDNRLRTGLNISIPLGEAWSVEVGYQYMHNYSNSELYTYSQHLINSGISWSF